MATPHEISRNESVPVSPLPPVTGTVATSVGVRPSWVSEACVLRVMTILAVHGPNDCPPKLNSPGERSIDPVPDDWITPSSGETAGAVCVFRILQLPPISYQKVLRGVDGWFVLVIESWHAPVGAAASCTVRVPSPLMVNGISGLPGQVSLTFAPLPAPSA
jgi:hypothetical protein